MNHAEKIKSLASRFLVPVDSVNGAGKFMLEFFEAIDEMQAEIDRATQNEKEGWRYAKELEQDRKRTEEEIDLLKQDAERLDWMSRTGAAIDPKDTMNPKAYLIWIPNGQGGMSPGTGISPETGLLTFFTDYREAIDAAMQAQGDKA